MSEDKTVYVRVVELEQEVIKLKELNREMVEALRWICINQCSNRKEKYCDNLSNDPCVVKEALTKANGEG